MVAQKVFFKMLQAKNVKNQFQPQVDVGDGSKIFSKKRFWLLVRLQIFCLIMVLQTD